MVSKNNRKALKPSLRSKSRNALNKQRLSRQTEDLSIYEEQKGRTFLKEIGKRAAINAMNENKAMGIPITFLEGDWVVRKMPNGDVVRIKHIPAGIRKTPVRKLGKGTVIHIKNGTR